MMFRTKFFLKAVGTCLSLLLVVACSATPTAAAPTATPVGIEVSQDSLDVPLSTTTKVTQYGKGDTATFVMNAYGNFPEMGFAMNSLTGEVICGQKHISLSSSEAVRKISAKECPELLTGAIVQVAIAGRVKSYSFEAQDATLSIEGGPVNGWDYFFSINPALIIQRSTAKLVPKSTQTPVLVITLVVG